MIVTDGMVAAYLTANDAYWRESDSLPRRPGVWRNGTPKEATRVSLEAALAAVPPAEGLPVAPTPFAWWAQSVHGRVYAEAPSGMGLKWFPLYAAAPPTAPAAVPQGWRLVPIEPTPEMLKAAFAVCSVNTADWLAIYYRAMLAAAPAPTSGKDGTHD